MPASRNTGWPSSRGHRIARAASALALAAVAACADAPAAPDTPEGSAAPRLEVVSPDVKVNALRRTRPLEAPITRSIRLYKNGGKLDIPEAGFHLNVPRTAIGNDPITITVTALAGDLVAYEFGPHGTVFNSRLNVTQDLELTTWQGNSGNASLEAAYFTDVSKLDPVTGSAYISEFLPVQLAATGARLHFDIRHFSGYMVSWGRK